MNVISLHQPYASLVIAGIKGWETRGCPPNGDLTYETPITDDVIGWLTEDDVQACLAVIAALKEGNDA